MTSIADEKRLNDEELEAVAGGVTAPSMDPTAFHNDMQGYVAGHANGLMPHASLPPAPTPSILHTNLDSMPSAAAALTHAPTGGDGSHPTQPTLSVSGLAPIKR